MLDDLLRRMCRPSWMPSGAHETPHVYLHPKQGPPMLWATYRSWLLKLIKLDRCAFALEPQDPADRIGALDIARLRRSGITQAAIDIYRRYQSGLVDSGSPNEGISSRSTG
jgi:hypothetical protein